MNNNKLNITICLGSSCYSRGNKETVTAVQEFLEDKNMSENVNFKGGHCFENCSEGPVMIVNDEKYFEIDPDKAIEILDNIISNNS